MRLSREAKQYQLEDVAETNGPEPRWAIGLQRPFEEGGHLGKELQARQRFKLVNSYDVVNGEGRAIRRLGQEDSKGPNAVVSLRDNYCIVLFRHIDVAIGNPFRLRRVLRCASGPNRVTMA